MDDRKLGFGRFSLFPPVIKGLIIANAVVFVLEYFFLNIYTAGGYSLKEVFFSYFALFPLGEDSNFYIWQLITYQFMHGGFTHILFNLFALWMFGAELEQMWGSRKFLVFYLLSGIGAGLVQLFISPMISTTGPTVGASGSIFGILLAFALTFPERPIFIFPLFIPIKAKFFILGYVVLSFIMGFSGGDGVAHFAHLGGAATGFLLLKFGEKAGLFRFVDSLFVKKTATQKVWQNYREEPKVHKVNWQYKPNPQPKYETKVSSFEVNGEEITQAKIDEILDKISASGYQNLSEREKNILFELSQKLK